MSAFAEKKFSTLLHGNVLYSVWSLWTRQEAVRDVHTAPYKAPDPMNMLTAKTSSRSEDSEAHSIGFENSLPNGREVSLPDFFQFSHHLHVRKKSFTSHLEWPPLVIVRVSPERCDCVQQRCRRLTGQLSCMAGSKLRRVGKLMKTSRWLLAHLHHCPHRASHDPLPQIRSTYRKASRQLHCWIRSLLNP